MMAQTIREKAKIRQNREEDRLTEDEIARKDLGPRGEKGVPDTATMTDTSGVPPSVLPDVTLTGGVFQPQPPPVTTTTQEPPPPQPEEEPPPPQTDTSTTTQGLAPSDVGAETR